jgi:hypothetical protein
MTRSRWPDLVIILGIVALALGGVWVLWGDDIRDAIDPPAKPEIEVPSHVT